MTGRVEHSVSHTGQILQNHSKTCYYYFRKLIKEVSQERRWGHFETGRVFFSRRKRSAAALSMFAVVGNNTMAAKLLKHFGIGSSKKVSDQPCQGDFVTAGKATTTPAPAAATAAAATTGSVQELRSTSPSKTNRASAAFVVTSNSWLGSGGTGPDPAVPGAGPGDGADGRRHSDASTIRSFRSRLPSHLKADLSFRGLSSRSTVTPAPRRDPCCEVGGVGGRGAKSPCADRTDCLPAENDESKKSVRVISFEMLKLYSFIYLIMRLLSTLINQPMNQSIQSDK